MPPSFVIQDPTVEVAFAIVCADGTQGFGRWATQQSAGQEIAALEKWAPCGPHQYKETSVRTDNIKQLLG